MATLKSLIILAILAYAGVLALMYVFQRSLMYFPDRARTPPAAAGLPQAEEVTLTSADGERLIAWYVPPQGDKPLVIYFHGNGGALNLRADRFRWLTTDGFGLLGLSYRGYGGSSGKPSESGLLLDAIGRLRLRGGALSGRTNCPLGRVARHRRRRRARRRTANRRTDPRCAVQLRGRHRRVRLSLHTGPLVHQGSFRSDERIGKVRAPLLVLHGEQDRIVPIRFGEKLFELGNEPKRMVRFPLGDHVDLDDHGAPDAVRAFLNGLPRTLN